MVGYLLKETVKVCYNPYSCLFLNVGNVRDFTIAISPGFFSIIICNSNYLDWAELVVDNVRRKSQQVIAGSSRLCFSVTALCSSSLSTRYSPVATSILPLCTYLIDSFGSWSSGNTFHCLILL